MTMSLRDKTRGDLLLMELRDSRVKFLRERFAISRGGVWPGIGHPRAKLGFAEQIEHVRKQSDASPITDFISGRASGKLIGNRRGRDRESQLHCGRKQCRL